MRNKFIYASLGIIVIFIITNPSVRDFKDHLGKTSYQGLLRDHNFFIWSTYVDRSGGYSSAYSNHYLACLGNFFIETKNSVVTNKASDSTVSKDTPIKQHIWTPPATDEEVIDAVKK